MQEIAPSREFANADSLISIERIEMIIRNDKDIKAAESVSERMCRAIDCLCTGAGDVRSRLISAGQCLHPLQKHEFPEELQKDFEWIMTQLTRYPPRHKFEGSFEGTMARIKRKTGVKIAERIYDMFHKIQQIRGHFLY